MLSIRALAIFVAVVTVLWFLSFEPNRHALMAARGSIVDTRSILGIRVGMTFDEARPKLQQQGFLWDEYDSVSTPPNPLAGSAACYVAQPAGERIGVFADQTWRRAQVCLSLTEAGIVRRIDWSYNPGAP